MLKKVRRRIVEKFYFFVFARYYKRLLEAGGEKGVAVIPFRCTGKTTSLVKYAKKYGYAVIVPDMRLAWHLKKQFGYGYIYSIEQYRPEVCSKCVFDTGVDVDKLMWMHGSHVVTGFRYYCVMLLSHGK